MHQQQLKFDYEHTLLITRMEVQEQAFQSVSRDIHDNIAQNLGLGCLQLANIKDTVADPEMVVKLKENLQVFRKVVKDLRLLSHSLHTGLVEQRTLEQSVKAELDRIEAFSGIHCQLEINGTDTLHPDRRLLVFRILQEGLQNVLKHAKATVIEVSLTEADGLLRVMVRDNGVGYAPSNESTSSLGLISMQQRATQLGATLVLNGLQGAGTTLTLELPIDG